MSSGRQTITDSLLTISTYIGWTSNDTRSILS